MGRWSLVVAAAVVVGVLMWRLVLDPSEPAEEALPDEPNATPAVESPREPEPVAQQPTPGAPEAKQELKPGNQPAPTSPSPTPTDPEQTEELVPIPAPEATGPIVELKQAFESEPRDSAAQVPESLIQGEFKKSDIAPGLLKSVLCRKSVCRVETLWTPERAVSFMSVFMRLSTEFAPNLALDPHGAPDPKKEQQIDVYLPRLAPGAKPAEQ